MKSLLCFGDSNTYGTVPMTRRDDARRHGPGERWPGVMRLVLGADWMTIGTAAGFDPTTAGRIDWPLVAVRIAGAALVVPVMEELFWRSFLLRWLDTADFETVDPSQVTIKSVIVTSVLFGFEHHLWLAGIIAGITFSALYMRHRTIWSPILAHAVTNGLLGIWVVTTSSWSYW